MDVIKEYIVKHKKTGKDTLMQFGVIFATFVACIIVSILTMIIFPILQSISIFLLVGVAYLGLRFLKNFNLEFEYIQTNNEIDIDKIIARSSRKRIVTIDFKNIEICAKVSDKEHKREYENTNILKTFDCTGDGGDGVYFVDVPVDGGMNRILFQPPQSMIETAYKFNPRKVFI